MWFFMISCYILTALTFFCLGTAWIQSFLHFNVFAANHVTFIVFTSIIYCLTETLVIFFFVGTGVSIKEYVRDHNMNKIFHHQSIAIKRKVYPPLMLNLLLMMVSFIIVGAVDTHKIPSWPYQILFFISIMHFVYAVKIQNHCFRENTDIVLKMSGIARKT
jgi:hypothetical protein